jgi:hypothetical protein
LDPLINKVAHRSAVILNQRTARAVFLPFGILSRGSGTRAAFVCCEIFCAVRGNNHHARKRRAAARSLASAQDALWVFANLGVFARRDVVDLEETKMCSDYKSPFAFLTFDPLFALERRYRVRI